MLHTIKLYFVAFVMLVSATSCLDKFPKDAIPEREAMQSFSDAEQVLTGIYSMLKHEALYSGHMTLVPDIQCDLVHAIQGNTNAYGNHWNWTIRSNDVEIEAIYGQLYILIGNCNFFLDQVEAVRANVSADTEFDKLDMFTGEVYGIRALAYSELIKGFCKAYPDSDEKAKNELGVVLATSYFNKPVPRRSSLYDSYQLVLDDLTKAEELLDEDNDDYGSPFFSAAAVQALRARVSLYMQKWDDAITYSSKLIDRADTPFALADARVEYQNTGFDYYSYMWAYDKSTEIIFMVGFTGTSYGGKLGTVFSNIEKDYRYFYPDYVPSETALKLFTGNDLRGRIFQEIQTGYSSGLTCPLLMKYYGNRTFMTSYLQYGLCQPKVFRLSEQYLIRAEAYCRKNNLAQASKDLTELRRYRFFSGPTIVLEANKWLDQISEERVRELYMEGFRLQDLKRWGRGFQREMQSEAQPESAKLKIEPTNPKFVWPIPMHELQAPDSQVQPNESNN